AASRATPVPVQRRESRNWWTDSFHAGARQQGLAHALVVAIDVEGLDRTLGQLLIHLQTLVDDLLQLRPQALHVQRRIQLAVYTVANDIPRPPRTIRADAVNPIRHRF